MFKHPSADGLIRHTVIVAIVAGIFVLDVVTPLGMAIPLLYVFPVLLTNWACGRREALHFAAACSVLTILGFFLSPSGASLWVALFNRTVSLVVLWALAVFMTGQRRAVEEKTAAVASQKNAEVARAAALEARAHADAAMLGAVTGRRSLERQLTASESRLNGILQSVMDAIITVDDWQNIILFNEAAEKMFLCSAEEAIGRPLDRFIPERFRGGHRRHVEAFGVSGTTSRRMGTLGTVTGLRATGEEFPAEASISQVDLEGKMYFTVVLRDITERRRAEQRFQVAIESAPIGMLMVDERGAIQLVNRLVEEWFGYSRQELYGQPVEILVPERYRAGHAGHRATFMAHPESRQMGKGRELYALRKDGTEFPIEIGLSPVKTDAGAGVLASVVDITHRREIEQQLRQAERLAEMGTLASGMAHEIGTPMNVILGRAEQLMRKSQEEATKKSLGVIVAQVERITKIMNQLLTFARRKPSERRAVNLGQILDDCLEVLQERIRRTRVRVESRYETALHPVHVHADPDQMSQVFLNLFINAVHAMPDGGTLRIALERVDSQVKAVVADTGCGIPKEDLPRIFHPFFSTKEAGKGTGLGLTVVHNIVQEHGGSIAVNSALGEGTTFTILLPASK